MPLIIGPGTAFHNIKEAPCLEIPNRLNSHRTKLPTSTSSADVCKSPLNCRDAGGKKLACPDREKMIKTTPRVARGATRLIHAAILKNDRWCFAAIISVLAIMMRKSILELKSAVKEPS